MTPPQSPSSSVPKKPRTAKNEELKKATLVMNTADLVRLAKSHSHYDTEVNPALTYLEEMRKAPEGWLRRVHSTTTNSPTVATNDAKNAKKHLKESERRLLFLLCLALDVNRDGVFVSIGHAWGIGPRSVKNIFTVALENDDFQLTFTRKRRWDAGIKKVRVDKGQPELEQVSGKGDQHQGSASAL